MANDLTSPRVARFLASSLDFVASAEGFLLRSHHRARDGDQSCRRDQCSHVYLAGSGAPLTIIDSEQRSSVVGKMAKYENGHNQTPLPAHLKAPLSCVQNVRIRNIEASAEAMLRTFADQERDAQFYVVMDLSIGRTQSVSGLFCKGTKHAQRHLPCRARGCLAVHP